MKTIPKKVKVGPYSYDLLKVKDLRDEKGVEIFGYCQSDRHLISIRNGVTRDREQTIVVHELLHALWELSGMPNKVCEESFITTMSPLLLSMFKDNKKLTEYLLDV